MSQIIKLQEGGTVDKKFFTYPSGQIEQDRLLSAISTNLNKYLELKDWSSKKLQRFLNSVDNFITGIKNGNIKAMSEIGRFEDNRGISGNGVTDTRGTKRFHEDSEAATFLKWVLDAQTPYLKPEDKPKTPETKPEDNYEFDINNELNTYLANNIFHKSLDNFNDNNYVDLYKLNPTNEYDYGTRILNYLQKINPKNYGFFNNKQSFVQSLNNVRNNISNLQKQGKLNWESLRTQFSTLGLNSSITDLVYNYLHPLQSTDQQTPDNQAPSTEQLQTNPSLPEYVKPDKETSFEGITWNGNFNFNNAYYEYYLKRMNNPDAYTWRILKKLGDIPLTPEALNHWRILPDDRLVGAENYTDYSKLFRNTLSYLMLKKSDLISKTKRGNYVILPSINYKNKTVVVLDKDLKNLRRFPFSQVYDLNDTVKQLIDLYYSTQSHKNGGVLRAQQGSVLSNDKDTLDKLLKEHNNLLKYNLSTRYRNNFDNGTITRAKRDNGSILNLNNPTTNPYDNEQGGQETENQFWWNNWTNKLTNNSTLAEQWAKDYLNAFNSSESALKTKNYYNTLWFGNNNTFNFDKFKSTVGTTSKLPLWGDKLNGNGHDYYTADLYRTDNDEYDTLENLKSKGYSLPENDKPQEVGFLNVHTLSKSPETNNNSDNSHATAGTVSPSKIGYNWKPDAVLFGGSLARFWNIAAGNKKLLNEALSSLKPYLMEPKRFERNIYGDYASLSQANQNAAKVNTLASQSISSDAALNASQRLQGEKQAADERFKGLVANEQEIKRTSELALAQAKENMSEAVDTANKNRYNIYNNNLLRSQAKQGYIARRTDNINTLLSEFQKNSYDKVLRRQALDKEALDKYIQGTYTNNPELISMQAELEKWIKDGHSASDWPKYQEFVNLTKRLNMEALKLSLEYQGRLYGTGVNRRLLNGLTGYQATSIPQKKSGGLISEESKLKIAKAKNALDRDKLFYKSISEHTKDTSTNIRQLSAGMSKLLSQVIKPKK